MRQVSSKAWLVCLVPDGHGLLPTQPLVPFEQNLVVTPCCENTKREPVALRG